MKQLQGMTAFIPAAGYGTRMGELCKNNQKCMLPIWEEKKPILHYIVQNLVQCGCTKFVIAVNHCKEQIMDYFQNGAKYGIEITYVEGKFTCTYDTLMKAIDQLPDVFVYSHGDMIFRPEVYDKLAEKYNEQHISVISVMPNTYPEMTHPRITLFGDDVKEIIFKGAKLEKYPYMYLGGAIYNKSDFLDNFAGNLSGMVEKMLLQKFAKAESVKAVVYDREWRHFMNESDLQVAANEKNWLNFK